MNFYLIFDLVDKYFHYLIKDYGFSVVSKKSYASFDNAMIVLQSKECRIRVIRERGHVVVDVAPLSSPEESYDLATLVAYLTKETEQLNNRVPDYDDYDTRIEWQLENLAGTLQRYYTQLYELFRKETYGERRMELKEFINLRAKKRRNL